MSAEKQEEWQILEPTQSVLRLNFSELWRYRDLIMLFVRRDFVSVYKQTVLGPLWHLIQPLFTTTVYVMFGGLAKIETDGIPRVVFCLAGVVLWNYFASCLTKTASTFTSNSTIFGKVYFPRLTVPISIILSNLMSFFIQLFLLVPVLFLYRDSVHLNIYLLAIPVVVVMLAMLGLGAGLLVSSLTIKYRDLTYLIAFGVQLGVYATPVIYPMSITRGKIRTIMQLNPVSSLVELFRFGLFGKGTFTPETLLYSFGFAVVLLIFGILMFNRVERDFMDTV